MKTARVCKVAFVAGVVGVGLLGALTTTAEARRPGGGGGGCFCPTYMDPVLCPDGNVYSNACFAGCAGQTGCTNLGQGPVPVPM